MAEQRPHDGEMDELRDRDKETLSEVGKMLGHENEVGPSVISKEILTQLGYTTTKPAAGNE